MRWTDGRALIAAGSPFAPVEHEGRLIPIAQCHNVFVFPAVGLGLIASGARRVTDGMMLAAARALGENSPVRKNSTGTLWPSVHDLRKGFAPGVADGAEGVGFEAVGGILSEPLEDGINPVMHQGASWFDEVVEQRHRSGRPFSSQIISGVRFTFRLSPFAARALM